MLIAGHHSQKPSELANVNIIEDKVGKTISLDRVFVNEKGENVNLLDFAKDSGSEDESVLLINFVYFNCPMLCGYALDGLSQSLSNLDLPADKNYKIVSISMDTNDTSKRAGEYKKKYIEMTGREKYADKWSFLISSNNEVKAFAEDLGFKYTYDEQSGEFFHSAGVFVVNAKGLVSRVLYGIAPKTLDVKLSILEAEDSRFRTTIEKALLYCFRYNPSKNSYVVYIENIMRVAGLFFVLCVLTLIVVLKRKESYSIN